MKYYLDTCIWIDFIENRYDRLNPLGEYAFLFLKKCERDKDTILYSENVIYELKKYQYNFLEISKPFSKFLTKAKINNQTILAANNLKKLNSIPFGDALHLILTINNKATLISRDNHLLNFKETKKPEELL